MRIGSSVAVVSLSMLLAAIPAAADDKCKQEVGKAVWTVVPPTTFPPPPAPPTVEIGRVVGPSTGTLKAAISAYLTSLTPQQDGSLKSTSVEIWVLGPQDILIFEGAATFTPILGQPIGTVQDSLSLTVVGGTGQYAGATGSLQVKGTGYNIFGPAAGPGSSYFDVSYSGTVCRAR